MVLVNALNFIINLFDSSEKPLFSQEDHHQVSMSSACLNPFLCGFMNENFQGEFVKVLECWVRMGHRCVAPFQDWCPKWPSQNLTEETAKSTSTIFNECKLYHPTHCTYRNWANVLK